MTISIEPSRTSRRGFTLAELLVSMALATIIIGASTGSLMFMSRSTVGMGNYQDMNSTSRYSLEQFATDARMTVDVKAAAADSVTLDVFTAPGVTARVAYLYDEAAGTLTRQILNSSGGVLESRIYLRDLTDLSFAFYQVESDPTVERTETSTLAAIKEIQLRATLRRQALRVGNTNEIISARFMMRNRAVGQ